MNRPLAVVLAALAAATLAGCPEERPEAAHRVPAQRVPPALTVEPTAPARGQPDGGAPGPADGGAAAPAEAAPAAPRP